MCRFPKLLLMAVLLATVIAGLNANEETRKQKGAGVASAGSGAAPTLGTAARALDLLAAETENTSVGDPNAGGARRTRAAAAAAWLKLMADYAKPGGGSSSKESDDGEWFPRPVSVSLPIGRGGATMPVLILPVPVPADTSTQCSADASSSLPSQPSSQSQAAPSSQAYSAARTPQSTSQITFTSHSSGARTRVFETEEPAPPQLDYIVSSQQLVELFQSQAAPAPELPPALIPDYTAGEEEGFTGAAETDLPTEPGQRRRRNLRLRRYQIAGQFGPEPAGFTASSYGTPPVPRLERSVMLRADLTVPRSGYTEPYTVWWDAASGASRVDMHGGATSSYRMVMPDGRVQGVLMRVDRSGDGEVKRCTVSAPRAQEPADRLVPSFPDMEEFTFAGYLQAESGRVERWVRTLGGEVGALGGARGEALTFRHEVLVARAPDNYTATPLRYSVAVDSSVLGADCDGYVHRYKEIRDQRHDPDLFTLNTEEACEQLEPTTRRERVEPLREYTLPHRDERYNDDYQTFKALHRRRYLDDTEEAVRKTLLVQHTRFIDSGNRQGATFSMEVNHLGDRLEAELALLGGVREEGGGLPAERFPHSRDQVSAMRASLPRHFDWRTRGAVSHVRYQGSCSTCWAFAVAGAVEGALYVRTRRLIPLSEQCLVDCAHPYGGHGCGRTWPSAAYDYITERGLPALAEYTPYADKKLTCLDRRVPPVTHISGHVNVTSHSVQALKVAIRRHAPSVVIVDSTTKSFQFYKSGVLFDDRCSKTKPDHAVLAVGWGEKRREPHFILKNSWSDKWGDGGYIRVAASSNTCGVLTRPSYPRLERKDVDSAAATAAVEPRTE